MTSRPVFESWHCAAEADAALMDGHTVYVASYGELSQPRRPTRP